MKPGYKHNPSKFIDVSDYARPLAVLIANYIKNTKIQVNHITVFHFALTLLAAYLIQTGIYLHILLGCLLLLAKNVIDAVDGSVARLRNKPSKVGRFLDSNLDFIGNITLFTVIPSNSIWLKIFAFTSFTIHCSIYNYWSIKYQEQSNNQVTSQTKETGKSKYPYDNKTALKILFAVYQIFYGWQDWITRRLFDKKSHNISSKEMILLSINGLGFQQIIIIISLVIGYPELSHYWFILMNIPMLFFIMKHTRNEQ